MKNDPSKEEKWAYIAGLIDADGCVMLSKSNNRVHYRTQVTFVNTNKEVIDWVSGQINFNYHRVEPSNPTKNRKTMYQIVTQSRPKVKALLEKILPYLIIKRRRAELVLEYLTLHNWRQGMREPLLPREEEIYMKMKQLNKVGVR